MKRLNRWGVVGFVGLVAFSLLMACDPQGDGPIPHESDVAKLMSVKLDPALSHDEKVLLIGDLYNTMQFQVQAKKGSYFEKAFGGTGTLSVVNYLDDRINYLLPQSVALSSRLGYLNAPASNLLGWDESSAQKGKIYTLALNIGTALWFQALVDLPQKLAFTIGDAKIPLTSSRVGIVQLGEGYTLKKKDGSYVFPAVIRVATLVHEARHSDCTGGLKASDLQRIKDGDLPENHACGHLHVQCPAGSPYEGAYACDAEAWGAYSIEALYALGVMKACKNCTEADKKVAEASAADSLSRVIPLDDMIQGKLGDPDMSSSSSVTKDQIRQAVHQFRRARIADPAPTRIELN